MLVFDVYHCYLEEKIVHNCPCNSDRLMLAPRQALGLSSIISTAVIREGRVIVSIRGSHNSGRKYRFLYEVSGRVCTPGSHRSLRLQSSVWPCIYLCGIWSTQWPERGFLPGRGGLAGTSNPGGKFHNFAGWLGAAGRAGFPQRLWIGTRSLRGSRLFCSLRRLQHCWSICLPSPA